MEVVYFTGGTVGAGHLVRGVALARALARGGSGVRLRVLGRVLDLRDPGAPFPAARWLGGADRVVAGAGYNAFWESRWLGWHARTRFVPFERRIDDQARRVAACADVPLTENGADALAAMLTR